MDTSSSGVVTVMNSAPAREDTAADWRLVPDLRIGAEAGGGPAQFGRVQGIAVDDSGRIFVLDGQAQHILIFAPTGAFIRTVGRKGEGPGEFRGAYGLAMAGDALWVPDHANERYTAFDRHGRLLGTYRANFSTYGYIWSGAVTRDGGLCQVASLPITAPPDERSYELQCYRPVDLSVPGEASRLPEAGASASSGARGPDASGSSTGLSDADATSAANAVLVVDTSYAVVRPHMKPQPFILQGARGTRGVVPVPFTPLPLWRFDPRGDFWSASTGRYRIVETTLGGDTTLVVEARRPVVRVTAEDRDAAVARIKRFAERIGADLPDVSRIPSTRPPLQAMDLDSRGRLWVRPTVAGATTLFDVFSRRGRHIATVRTALRIPTYWHPMITDTAVYTLVTDSLDVPYVVRARIVR